MRGLNTTVSPLEPLVAENLVLNSTPKRRHGREVEEIAKLADASVHKARMAVELRKYAPELLAAVAAGEMRLSEAVRIVREVRPMKRRREETTFTEQVTRSFEKWSRRWPADAMPQVREIIHQLTKPR
jgi:hypothetical protein